MNARRVTKALAVFLVLIILTPLGAFAVYDAVVFQSRRIEIDRILSSAMADARSPPIDKLVRAAYGDRLAPLASRLLMRDLDVRPESDRMLQWHSNWALWWAMVALHLSEQEQIAVIAARSYLGNGIYGFSNGAQVLFGRPLSALSLSEAATVVALAHAPSSYLESPERLAKRRDFLMERVQNGF